MKSRGGELGATHNFTNGVSFIGSYTFLDAEISENATNEGNKLARIPENAAALWVNYAFQDPQFEGLSIGAGVRYVDERFSDSANTESRIAPEITVFDASVSYDWNDWSATLAARNIADETDVTFCSPGVSDVFPLIPTGNTAEAGGCALSEGRTVSLSLTRTF